MGGGGKGGSQTTVQEIPKWLEEPTVRNLARAEQAANIGYTPYYGPEVAAFNPTQMAAMQSNIGAAEAFGLVPQGQLTAAQGMPAPTTYAGGMQGYGSGDLYEQAVAELAARRPGQVAAMEKMYVDPNPEQNPAAQSIDSFTLQLGASNDPLWEQMLSEADAAHRARYGIDWNTGRTSDADRLNELNRLKAQYQAARG